MKTEQVRIEDYHREGTLSTVRYGDHRNSTGTIPTDKQFTGQRLDSTGLYYYGARYYDATIGRFISADPIVSQLFNPQAWNRFSYCANNPLKFIDPSGLKYVVHGDSKQDWSFREALAAIVFGENVNENVKSYIKEQIFGDEEIDVYFDVSSGESYAISDMVVLTTTVLSTYTVPNQIHFGSNFTGRNLEDRAGLVAHEAYHIFEGSPGTTIQEEVTGYFIQHIVASELGYNYGYGTFEYQLWNMPIANNFSEYLKNARELLSKAGGNAGAVYQVAPLTQSAMRLSDLLNELRASGTYSELMGAPNWVLELFIIGVFWH